MVACADNGHYEIEIYRTQASGFLEEEADLASIGRPRY